MDASGDDKEQPVEMTLKPAAEAYSVRHDQGKRRFSRTVDWGRGKLQWEVWQNGDVTITMLGEMGVTMQLTGTEEDFEGLKAVLDEPDVGPSAVDP